jgi:hypothetical protein
MKDRFLHIWEIVWNRKTTLFLLVLGQAVNLYIWQMHSLTNVAYLHEWAAFAVALLTAFALDSAQVQIAIAEKTKRLHWIIAIIASIIFLALGIWIAVDVMKDAMHAAFAVGVFMYSWYSALVHTPTTVVYARQMPYPAPTQIQPTTQVKTTVKKKKAKGAIRVCPNCNATVSASSYYRIKVRGYCSKCKI